VIDWATVDDDGFPTGKRCIFLVRVRPSWDEVSLWSLVSSMHLLTAGAVGGEHLVCVAVGVLARLGRGGSDALVAILGWIRCGVPLTDRSGAQHSFNRIIGIDSHVVLWH
jgi:hypothetical protein